MIRDRREIELAEPTAEGNHPWVRDGLVPEPQHLVVEPGTVDAIEDDVAHWSREIDVLIKLVGIANGGPPVQPQSRERCMTTKPVRLNAGGDPATGMVLSNMVDPDDFTTDDRTELISHHYTTDDQRIVT